MRLPQGSVARVREGMDRRGARALAPLPEHAYRGGTDASARGPIGGLLTLVLWLGLAYGTGEALEVMLLSFIPGALSWRTGNSADVLWFAPPFYGAAFTLLALPVLLLAWRWRQPRWDAALVFGFTALGAFLALTLPTGVLSDLAAAVLALGLASELTRQYFRRTDLLRRWMRRSLPYLAALPLLAALVVVGGSWLRERAALAALPAAPAGRPSILLLIIDTQRADHLSSYGYARPTSPNVDRFALEGVRFANAYSPSSWTLPSHATFMTGRQIHEHGAGLIRRPYLDRYYPTVAEELQRLGYATGGFVANGFWTGRQTGLNRGFLHYEDFYGSLGDAAIRTVLGRRLAYEVLPRFGLEDIPGRKHASDVDGDFLDWVGGLNGRPFFAFINYFDVHGPYLPPQRYRRFSGDSNDDAAQHKIDIGAIAGDIEVPPQPVLGRLVDRYDESILYLDAQLGDFFRQLRARGLLDNTAVILTSDHGESYGEHGMMYHGHSLAIEQLHVPLVIRFPARVAPGRVDSREVATADVAATIADLAGLPRTAFPGSSLLAQPPAVPQPILSELGQRSLVSLNWVSSRAWQGSLIEDGWHYLLSGDGRRQLFDLRVDPAEAHDRAGAEPARVEALDRTLARLAPATDLRWSGWRHPAATAVASLPAAPPGP